MLSIVLAFTAVTASTQTAVPAAGSPREISQKADEEQLAALNAVWLNAYVTRDRAALASVLAEDFIGVYGEVTLSKKEMLDGLAERRITKVTWADLRVRISADTAVVTAISTVTMGAGTTATTARYRYADIYARRNGSWRAIASHVLRLPA